MEGKNWKHPKLLYVVLLVLGFLGLCLPRLLHLAQGGGVATAVWILSFICLTCNFRSKRCTLLSGGVFFAGYFLKYLGAVDSVGLYSLLCLVMGSIQFGIFYGYSRIAQKWNRFITTLAFPLLWTAVYLLAMLARVPMFIRVDMMFIDMNVLLQLESVIGSVGLSFVLLWIMAILAYGISEKKHIAIMTAVLLYLASLTFGLFYLYPNVTTNEYVRIAYSSGPYVGDYVNYTSLPVETYLNSMNTCVRQAAEQGAEILVFNEETYEFDDRDEAAFLEKCCEAARDNHIHVLLGMDLRDTDGSEGGKSQNKIVWIDPNGEILNSYLKNKTIPIIESDYVRGTDPIPCHTVTVGDRQIKVAYLICYDSNFPLYVNNIDDDTDILFLPSWDWSAVTEMHSDLCRTLAIENRVSIVKVTYDGLNIVVRSDGTVIHSSDMNDIGYEHVEVVDVPVSGASGYTLVPSEKKNYIYSIIGAEIMSILVCLTLLYGNFFESHEKSLRNRLYSLVVATCAVALTSDLLSWIFDGCERLEGVLYFTTVLSLLLSFVTPGEFIYYITEYIREKKRTSSTMLRIYTVYSSIIVLLIIISSRSGLIFTFNNGVYEDGPLYGLYVITNIVTVLFCLLQNTLNRDVLSIHDRIAALTYVLLPSIAAVINLFVEEFSYAYPATTLSFVVVYIMIQSERENRLEKEGFVISHRATHDIMTGLWNRLAYEDRLQELSTSKGMVGVIFTDMNGLKYTNDHFGHVMGDRMLIRYAELLGRFFRRDDIYRISGDEFTILISDMEFPALEKRMKEFEKALQVDDIALACAGFDYGESKNIDELLKSAESLMYAKKLEFHRLHPEMNRS